MAKSNLAIRPKSAIASNYIDEFAGLIQSGINAWINAGQLLCDLITLDPNVFPKITQRVPWLTSDILGAFKRIGEKTLYPYLLLDASPASRKLSELPFALQSDLYGKPIPVVFKYYDGSFRESEIPFSTLTRAQADLSIGPVGIRTIDEQTEILKSIDRNKTRQKTRLPSVATVEELEPDAPSDINETPIKEVARRLQDAQIALIGARASLGMLGREIHKDQETFIEIALKGIGELRYAINNE